MNGISIVLTIHPHDRRLSGESRPGDRSYGSKGRLSECDGAIGERQVNRDSIAYGVIHMALRWSAGIGVSPFY